MLVQRSGERSEKVCWLSTLVSTNGSQKGPTGAYDVTPSMAVELGKHYYSILQRNTGKNF
jgi:hypothetical protein